MNIFTQVKLSRSLFFATLFLLTAKTSRSQLPTCNTPGIVYIHNGSNIQNFDQHQPYVLGVNPTNNAITMPPSASGLAVGPNMNAPTPATTFYTTVSGMYYYYDGTVWVNTGHTTGNTAAVNIAAGGGYLYNLVGASGDVYIYDGTGNGSLLTTVTGFAGGGPYDLVADEAGNWYILKMTATGIGQFLRKYSPTGALLDQWNIAGAPGAGGSGGGFAVVCDSIYVNSSSGYYTGFIDNANSLITLTSGTGPSGSDWASCPAGVGTGTIPEDTVYYCGTGPGVQVTALVSPGATLTWTVLSGNAVINGTGNTITLTSTGGISRILFEFELIGGGQGLCGSGTDTVTLVVPTANLDAGLSVDSIRGCGVFTKSLNATLSDTTEGLTYNIAWSPAPAIATGANSLNPVITPTANTTYVITVSTPANQGGCNWTDTVEVYPIDRSVNPDFDFDIDYGCNEDTIQFNNLSTLGTFYRWDFSDGTGDTAMNPLKIYPNQNAYNVKLVVENETCIDSVTKVVDTQHPLAASFSPDMDSVCEGAMISFTNTSTYTTIEGPASFFWDFGDGTTDTLENTTHVYTAPGEYEVMMVVTDFVPCSDTSYHTIVIDPYPVVDFTTSDSVLCEGQFIEFTAHYTDTGFVDLAWDFGDGKTLSGGDVVAHGYDTSGVFTITLTTNYRICPQQVVSRDVMIYPFPTLNLGPDTTLCPNGEGLLIGDRTNQFTSANWNWNTGDTTAFIVVRHPGIYSAKVSRNGCSTDDSVEVSKDCYLDIPNSFTPNGDGVNDYFLPRQHLSRGLTEFKMVIFNRWGQVIFETQSIDGRGWDGKFNGEPQPTGVYVYQIEAAFKNGVREQYTGNVTLIR